MYHGIITHKLKSNEISGNLLNFPTDLLKIENKDLCLVAKVRFRPGLIVVWLHKRIPRLSHILFKLLAVLLGI